MARLADKVDPRLKAAYLDVLHQARYLRYPTRRVTRQFTRHHGTSVLAGPFKGMRYPRFAVGRGELVVPQLIGAYEQELHGAFEELIAAPPQQIVDIGASDGYYAVGLALRCPEATVVAYEINPFPARVCTALAEENGVAGRIVLKGEATLDSLRELPTDLDTFVLCDCEGGEALLMDPEEVPLLRGARLIVELHDFAAPGIEERISRRFEATHDIEVLESGTRYVNDYPALVDTPGISYMDRALGVAEFRPVPIRWAVMRPRGA